MADEKKQKAGRARWKGVPEERRKALVSQAAHARWKNTAEKVRVAEYPGTIDLAGFELSCAVLDDGTRVLSERSVSGALTHHRSPNDYGLKRAQKDAGQEVLPAFISPTIAAFLPAKTREKLANPIRYQMKKGFGIPAIGVEATLLADICEAYLAAREAGTLPPEEFQKAQAADKLMRALARVALVALIDEATGFQVARDRDELQKLLAKYVSEEHRPWLRKFPDEFYVELFRLRNVKTDDVRKRPQYFGKITNDIVYSRLVPGVLPRLEDVNPKDKNGNRARRHHQHIIDQGETHLNRHIAGVVYLMKSSTNWLEFMKGLNRASPVQTVPINETTSDDEGDDGA